MALTTPGYSGALGTVEEIVACAVALGADRVGGPLSPAECQQVAWGEGIEVEDQHLAVLRDQIRDGLDPLGDALNSLRSAAARRSQGAILSPRDIVSPMVKWILQQNVDLVVDPGCGSGRFALEAARQANCNMPVVAIDCDPVATLLCRAGAASLDLHAVTVIQDDYLTANIPLPQGVVGYVGNPPYVRHHQLSRTDKEWGRGVAYELQTPWSGLAGLHVLFVMATARRMRPSDVCCFITSAEWLDVRYGCVLRHLLARGPRLLSLHLLDARAAAFVDVMTTSVIFCAQNGSSNDQVRLRLVEEVAELNDLSKEGRIVDRQELAAADRWSPLVYSRPTGPRPRGLVPLGTLVRVSRGVATGANDFFVMSKEQVSARGLGDFARTVVASADEVFRSQGVLYAQAKTKYVVDVPSELAKDAFGHPALARFLQEGERRSVPTRYLCRQRRYWWVLSPQTPPIVATYMARRPPAFALNPDGMAILNVCHGLYPRVQLSDVQLRGLVTYLNSLGTKLSGAGRTYQGGLQKFEPREMESILVPPPEQLERQAQSTL